MASEDIVIRFIIEDKRFKQQSDAVVKKLSLIEKQTKLASRAFSSFAGNLAARGVEKSIQAIGSAIGQATRNLIDFEKALVGVGKTTNLEGRQLELLGNEIQALSRDLPVATTELLQITQNAAQLGVRGTDALIKFTDTAAKLGLTTDLSAQQASVGLAKLLNLTSENATTVDKLGAVFVELGNNFATTESAILSVSTEVARATTQFGLTSAEVAGISTALSALGIQSEVAGTSVGRTFRRIQEAIDEGGSKFKILQNVIGESGETIEKEFGERPVEVFQKFIQGLGQVQEQGGNVNKVLKGVGLANDRLLKVLPPLIKRNDLLADALASARREYEQKQALEIEAAKQTATLDSEVKELGNTYDDFTENLLKNLTPALKATVKGTKELIEAMTIGDTISTLDKEIVKLSEDLTRFREESEKPISFFDEGTRNIDDVNASINRTLASLDAAIDRKYELKLELATPDEKPLIEAEKRIEVAFLRVEQLSKTASEAALANAQTEVFAAKAAKQKILDQNKEFAEANRIIEFESELVTIENKNNTLLELLRLENEYRVAQGELSQERLAAIKTEASEEYAAKKAVLDKLLEDTTISEEKRKELTKARTQLTLQEAKTVNTNVTKSEKDKEETIKSSLGTIGGLMSSSSKEAFELGKAANIAQATMNGYTAVTTAYKQGGAFFGPALAAGVALAVAGQIQGIASTQFQGGNFAEGGIVPGNSFTGDNVVANVNSAEMILNREQQGRLLSMADGKSESGGSKETVVNTTIQIDGETIGKAVSRQVADGLKLGENI